MDLDGAEDAPSERQGEDCGRVPEPSLAFIKDGLESSCGWCVRPVEEKKKDCDCNLHDHLEP